MQNPDLSGEKRKFQGSITLVMEKNLCTTNFSVQNIHRFINAGINAVDDVYEKNIYLKKFISNFFRCSKLFSGVNIHIHTL